MVDLGSIQLESDTNLISTLPQEEAALYECLRLSSKDISAYVVDGEFSFTGLEAAGASAIAEARLISLIVPHVYAAFKLGLALLFLYIICGGLLCRCDLTPVWLATLFTGLV